jgi:hypothetical protein
MAPQSGSLEKSPPIRFIGCLLRHHQTLVFAFILAFLTIMSGCAYKPHANVIASEDPTPAKSKIALNCKSP